MLVAWVTGLLDNLNLLPSIHNLFSSTKDGSRVYTIRSRMKARVIHVVHQLIHILVTGICLCVKTQKSKTTTS